MQRQFRITGMNSFNICHSLLLKVLATIPYFNFHFYSHLLIFLQFGDSSYVLNLSFNTVLQKWHIYCKRVKYLQFELIFVRHKLIQKSISKNK